MSGLNLTGLLAELNFYSALYIVMILAIVPLMKIMETILKHCLEQRAIDNDIIRKNTKKPSRKRKRRKSSF